ncbi:hypothetical protein Bpfe_005183, partial [Biomphalaria pfeifferi]
YPRELGEHNTSNLREDIQFSDKAQTLGFSHSRQPIFFLGHDILSLKNTYSAKYRNVVFKCSLSTV